VSAFRRAAACAALGLLLAACAGHRPKRDTAPARGASASASRGSREPAETARPQSERYRQNDDDGPAAPSIDVGTIAEPVPKVEPRSRYGNKQSYSVLGRTYHVLDEVGGYDETGIASWYGNKFHGYMTSSFEPYDMYKFTAAHKTLPLPSYARVTNLDNGKSVVVRINDRGPFHEGRIIDLSYAAAVRIGVWPKGTARVEVRAIDPAQPGGPARTRIAAASRRGDAAVPTFARPVRSFRQLPPLHNGRGSMRSDGAQAMPVPESVPIARPDDRSAADPTFAPRIYLQLGAFGERVNAEHAAAAATRAGLEHVGIESVAVAGHTVHRVRVGPLADADAADALTARIEKLGLGAPRVAIER
jgi:rare lipoprotein A